jgi:uncharacterized protein
MRLHEPDGYECRSAASSESGGLAMRPRIHVVTLAAADLDRALTFYRDGMGFPTEGLIGTEFQGDEGTPDGPRRCSSSTAASCCRYIPLRAGQRRRSPLTGPKTGEFSIGHVVATRTEVDEVIAQAKAAGAAVADPPHDRPWGIYSGYFQDPDGHLWEVIWNPALDLGSP